MQLSTPSGKLIGTPPNKTTELNKTIRNTMDISPRDFKETRSSNNEVTYRPYPSYTRHTGVYPY